MPGLWCVGQVCPDLIGLIFIIIARKLEALRLLFGLLLTLVEATITLVPSNDLSFFIEAHHID